MADPADRVRSSKAGTHPRVDGDKSSTLRYLFAISRMLSRYRSEGPDIGSRYRGGSLDSLSGGRIEITILKNPSRWARYRKNARSQVALTAGPDIGAYKGRV